MTNAAPARPRLGELLKRWRSQRRLSQLDLAVQSGVSARHLSFVETGRSQPSREMVLHLADQLDVPLRDRNALLTAAGYAPVYRESSLDEPELASVRHAIAVILRNHEPMPALVVDRRWDLVDANSGVTMFLSMVSASLVETPVNVVRASLHPEGLAPRVVNFDEYAVHLVERLRRQFALSGDASLTTLLDEVLTYPRVEEAVGRAAGTAPVGVVLPVRLRLDSGAVLSFFTTMTVFGAPLDVTVSELAVESFFPADEVTAASVRAFAGSA